MQSIAMRRCQSQIDVTLDDVALTLLPGRAVWWADRSTLLIADAHFGKAAAFRNVGVPLPEPLESDLARLDGLIANTQARRLVVLGDLRHTRGDWSHELVELLLGWRRGQAALEVVLVRGNHDRHAGDPPAELGFTCVDEPWRDGELTLCHADCHEVTGPALCGHIHPAVVLPDGRRSVRVAAFVRRGNYLYLPTFGSFTGKAVVSLREVDAAWAIVGDELLWIKG